jgi:ABC-type glutathione transport system ATPase component
VVDETFARSAGLEVGDTIDTPDRPRRIVALSAGTNQFTNQLAFGELRDVQRLVRLRRDVNFFALQVEPGETRRVQERIRTRFSGVSPFSKPEFVANNEQDADHRPRDLSGGEKQRVAIARALANRPQIVFADEPTANLDAETGHEVAQILCRLASEERKAVLIVSHDERLRDIASRVVRVEDGRLRERV